MPCRFPRRCHGPLWYAAPAFVHFPLHAAVYQPPRHCLRTMDQRLKIGVISAVLLLISAVLYLWPVDDNSQALQAACLRVGAIMAVVWLAMPEASRLKNPWVIAAGIGAVILIIVNRKLIIPALGIFVLIYVLRPRPRLPSKR